MPTARNTTDLNISYEPVSECQLGSDQDGQRTKNISSSTSDNNSVPKHTPYAAGPDRTTQANTRRPEAADFTLEEQTTGPQRTNESRLPPLLEHHTLAVAMRTMASVVMPRHDQEQ
eukprot:scpid19194/ scgid35621/ 